MCWLTMLLELSTLVLRSTDCTKICEDKVFIELSCHLQTSKALVHEKIHHTRSERDKISHEGMYLHLELMGILSVG